MGFAEFRQALRDPRGDRSDPLLAVTLDFLRPDEALQVVPFSRIVERWEEMEPRLEESALLWGWMVEAARLELPAFCREPRVELVSRRAGEASTFRAPARWQQYLVAELARLWEEPSPGGVMWVRFLRSCGTDLQAAISQARIFSEAFSPLELAFRIGTLDVWEQGLRLEFNPSELTPLSEFAGSFAVRLLELCLEEAATLHGAPAA